LYRQKIYDISRAALFTGKIMIGAMTFARNIIYKFTK
jgi:hypothetical protein